MVLDQPVLQRIGFRIVGIDLYRHLGSFFILGRNRSFLRFETRKYAGQLAVLDGLLAGTLQAQSMQQVRVGGNNMCAGASKLSKYTSHLCIQSSQSLLCLQTLTIGWIDDENSRSRNNSGSQLVDIQLLKLDMVFHTGPQGVVTGDINSTLTDITGKDLTIGLHIDG